MVDVFDYLFEESDSVVSNAFDDFAFLKSKRSKFNLVSASLKFSHSCFHMVLRTTPSRSLLIGGYLCRVVQRAAPCL